MALRNTRPSFALVPLLLPSCHEMTLQIMPIHPCWTGMSQKLGGREAVEARLQKSFQACAGVVPRDACTYAGMALIAGEALGLRVSAPTLPARTWEEGLDLPLLPHHSRPCLL